MLESLSSLQNKPKQLFLELYTVWQKDCEQKTNNLETYIVRLNKEARFDFCKLAVDAINSGVSCFSVIVVLEAVLPKLELRIESLLMFSERMFVETRNDSMSYKQYLAFRNLAKEQPSFAQDVLSALLSKESDFIVNYISNIIVGLAESKTFDTINKLEELHTQNSPAIQSSVLASIALLPESLLKENIARILEILRRLEIKINDPTNTYVIESYSNLLQVSSHAQSKIIELSSYDEPATQYAISIILLRNSKRQKEKWFSNALMNLSKVSANNTQTLQNLDLLFASLLESGEIEIVESFFDTWFVKSKHQTRTERIHKIFETTLAALLKRKELLQILTTKLLNHDSSRMHSVAGEIVSFCETRGITLILDPNILRPFKYEDCLFICRKILGYIIDPKNLCSLSFSLLDKSVRNKEIQNLVYSVFSTHIAEAYPSQTKTFLEDLSNKTSSKIKKSIAKKVINEIEVRWEQRSKLPKLKELVPSKQKFLRVNREQNKKTNAAWEDAQKESIFLSVVSRKVLLHGKGSFCFINGELPQYSEPTKLASMTTSVDIPNTEITQPVQAALDRAGFRLARRGD